MVFHHAHKKNRFWVHISSSEYVTAIWEQLAKFKIWFKSENFLTISLTSARDGPIFKSIFAISWCPLKAARTGSSLKMKYFYLNLYSNGQKQTQFISKLNYIVYLLSCGCSELIKQSTKTTIIFFFWCLLLMVILYNFIT